MFASEKTAETLLTAINTIKELYSIPKETEFSLQVVENTLKLEIPYMRLEEAETNKPPK